jgi:hypothetical protein
MLPGGMHAESGPQTTRDIIRKRVRPPMSTDTLRSSARRCLLAVVACLAAAPAVAQRGAITLPRNLDELTDRAQDIVRGTVVEARVEKHPELANLDTVVVTLRVRETLKGGAQGSYTFRQYIWDVRDRYDAAGYRKGQEVLMLMNAPSRYGLTSPVGMQQGRFSIRRDRSGRALAMNGTGNARLFERLAAAPARAQAALSPQQASLVAKHRAGPLAVEDLTALIRAYARSE